MNTFRPTPIMLEAILSLLALEINLNHNVFETEDKNEKEARAAFLEDFDQEFDARFLGKRDNKVLTSNQGLEMADSD